MKEKSKTLGVSRMIRRQQTIPFIQAISCGGIGVIMQMVKQLGLRKYIDDAVSVFKLHLPYDEADHVLNKHHGAGN